MSARTRVVRYFDSTWLNHYLGRETGSESIVHTQPQSKCFQCSACMVFPSYRYRESIVGRRHKAIKAQFVRRNRLLLHVYFVRVCAHGKVPLECCAPRGRSQVLRRPLEKVPRRWMAQASFVWQSFYRRGIILDALPNGYRLPHDLLYTLVALGRLRLIQERNCMRVQH